MTRAVVLPGRAYPATAPVLALAVDALGRHGCAVHAVEWQLAGAPDDPASWVCERLVEAAADGCDLVVGKSLGTWAAAYAGKQGWPAVWLTPVLTDAGCAAGIRDNAAPQLVVSGTADFAFDPEVAHGLGCELYEVEGADHALSHDDDLRLRETTRAGIADALDAFLGGLR